MPNDSLAKSFELYRNYRLPIDVARFAQYVGVDLSPFIESTYKSDENEKPRILRYGDFGDQVEAISRIIKAKGFKDVAILLPTIMEYNAAATGSKYRDIAKAMGVSGTESMSEAEYRKAAIDAVKKLSADVGIPADLKEIVKPEDVPALAASALADACTPGNPKDPTVEDIEALYRSLL